MSPAARLATAYHEAGHAVAAHALGIGVELVSVKPSEHGVGHVRHRPTLSRHAPETGDLLEAEDLIIIALAGPIAQRRFAPRSWRSHHGAVDFQRVVGLASAFCRSQPSANAFVAWMEVRAHELVDQHWPTIEAVAVAVNVAGDLNEAAFLAVVNAGQA